MIKNIRKRFRFANLILILFIVPTIFIGDGNGDLFLDRFILRKEFATVLQRTDYYLNQGTMEGDNSFDWAKGKHLVKSYKVDDDFITKNNAERGLYRVQTGKKAYYPTVELGKYTQGKATRREISVQVDEIIKK